jgi:polar amino acid transport system substrate-binding protein
MGIMPGGRGSLGIVAGLAAVTLLACSSPPPKPAAPPGPPPLVVGVDSTSPPYVFMRNGQLVGLEIDFARALSTALGRPLRLVDLEWTRLMPHLLEGKIDLIMSGMTVTPAREVRVAFSEPYLRSGLMALMRRDDLGRYSSPERIYRTTAAIAVVDGTTGDKFVREKCPDAAVMVYPTAVAAVTELRQRRIDLLIHDAPVVVWFASGNESELGVLLKPLDRESLAWAMRRSDDDLRTAINGTLAGWRTDGTLDRTLTRWLPYWRRLEAR